VSSAHVKGCIAGALIGDSRFDGIAREQTMCLLHAVTEMAPGKFEVSKVKNVF
jgi:hypothetical protein